MTQKYQRGFTLVEMTVVVAIISILSAIAVVNYSNTTRESEDGVTKGNLATLRSTIAIYYTDNDGAYPTDNLTSLTGNSHYHFTIPIAHVLPNHGETTSVAAEPTPSDTGGWSFNNVPTNSAWGSVRVGCLHQDMRGQTWTNN